MSQASEESDRPSAASESGDSATELNHVADAIQEVRREGRKVAILYAVLDGVLVLLAANVVLANLGLGVLSGKLPLPAVVANPVMAALGSGGGPVEISTSAVLAIGLGVAAFAVEYAVRVRRPLVEQFESANPDLRVALRTARDAAATSRETRMARRLYGEVLDRLGEASSARLLDVTRVGATVVVIVGLSLLTVQTAAVDFDLVGLDGSGPGGIDGSDAAREYKGLQDGDSVLGDVENVEAGDEEVAAQIASSGGEDDPDTGNVGGYDSGGFAGSGDVESQQSGYAPAEEIEDAALIREYNLKIRDDEE